MDGAPRPLGDTAKLLITAFAVGAVALVAFLIWREASAPTLEDLANRPVSAWGDDPWASLPWPAQHPWWSASIVFFVVLLIGRLCLFMRRLEDRR